MILAVPWGRMPLAAALFAGACNQVYGLEQTTIREAGIDAAPDLEDEDLDGVLNEFDNCPGLPNSDQADKDGDTVGNACDINPDVATEKIVGRYMFNRPLTDRADWQGSGWEFRDGYAEQPTLGEKAAMFTVLQPGGTIVAVEARMIVTFDRSSDSSATSIVLDGLGGDRCSIIANTARNGLYVFTALGVASGGALDPTDGIPFTMRALAFRVSAPQVPGTPLAYCEIGAAMAYHPASTKPADAIGIATAFNKVRLNYVVVYSTN